MLKGSKDESSSHREEITRRKKAEIEVLLAEYKACYMNRDNYDHIRWLIATIFVGASMTLFGLSFNIPGNSKVLDIVLMAAFSWAILFVWVAYNRHVGPYIRKSLERAFKIEEKLNDLCFTIELQKEIKKDIQIRGILITFSLIYIISFMWAFRLLMILNPGVLLLLGIGITGIVIQAGIVIYGVRDRHKRCEKGRIEKETNMKKRLTSRSEKENID